MLKNNLKLREKAAEEKRQWVRITRACNNDCLFCLDQEAHNGKLVPITEVVRVLKQGGKEGAARAIISGGEPTLHPQVFEIIRKARQLGYKHVQMISNGRMLAYENFVQKLKEAGLDEVTLSLHSHKKNDFEKMSGVKGSYLQAMRGLKNALDNNFIVSVDIVINKINYKTLKETMIFFEKMGVSEFDLLHLVPFGSAWKNKDQLFFSSAEAKKYLHRAFQLGKRKNLFIWTNRLPAAYLEGFEELIQHPIKMSGEIKGMERNFLEFVKSGKKMPCFGERCEFCFLHDFCADLSELRDKKFLEAKLAPPCFVQKKAPKKVFKFTKNFDIYEFLKFFIDHRYFIKSTGCSNCKYDQLCQGAQINEIRSKGFKILKSIKK
ncbi:MAG: radical SAM protein [Parcubacteria group bacterium]|jgi:MoaA/NifB/PqqE/SkfB family radical SAM enzyme